MTRFRFVVVAFALLCSLYSFAGTQNATVTGLVFEAGNPVPGATIHLINGNIGFSQTQTTGADGSFSFNAVPPAENYVISVEKAGFAPQVRSDLVLHVNEERLEIPPFLLQPATLTAEKPVPVAVKPHVSLDLLSSTAGGVVDTQSTHALPLVNRDFIDLALLIPGTYPVEQGSVLQGASLVVNGARATMNNFLLDGADNNDYTVNQSLPFQIVGAMQEFRVQSSTSAADFGRNAGSQINVVSRSGSNALHGELFEFNRNSGLGASNYFSAYSGGGFDRYAAEAKAAGYGDPLSDPTLSALYNNHKPRVNQNQFGGNVGGALIKDKLFGFFNWESFRLVNPLPVFEQVPGNPMRDVAQCSTALGVACDPTAINIFKLYPAPNVPLTAWTDPDSIGSVTTFGAFNTGVADNRTSSDNFLGRIDWRIHERNSMSFKYNIQLIDQIQAGSVPATATYPGSGVHVGGRNQNFSYNFVHQFTRATNEFRFGWNRFRLDATPLDAGIDPASLGLQALNFGNQGLPTVSIGGQYSTLAPLSTLGANMAAPVNRADNVWSVEDNFTLTSGRHNFRFGGLYRYVRLNVSDEALGRGVIALYDPAFAAGYGVPDVTSITRIDSQFATGFGRSLTTHTWAGYAQDQWRPLQNLTLNFGVRYEVNTAPVEVHNRLVNYYPSLTTSIGTGGLVQAGSDTVYDPFGAKIGTAPGNVPRAGYNTDTNNVSPRIGFAWDPWSNAKTVVRGGYSLNYDQQPLQASMNMLFNPPFVNQYGSVYGNLFPGTLATTFPTSANCATDGFCGLPYSITYTDENLRSPYLHQYHLGVEQQLSDNLMLGISYVGSSGHRLPMLSDASGCTPAEFYQSWYVTPSTQCYDYTANPFLFPSILRQSSQAASSFNSLQVRFDTRSFHGLQLHAFYQWAKSIDNSSSLPPLLLLFSPVNADLFIADGGIEPFNFSAIQSVSPALSLQGELPIYTTRPKLPQDSTNLGGERGPSDFDIRHRAVISYIYAIPKFAPHIGTGWQVEGITTLQSGQPFTVYADYFGTPLRPDVTGVVPTNMNSPQGAIDNGLNPLSSASAFDFTPTASLTAGSMGRNALSGPKFINFDFSVSKNTRLTERVNLQFKAEFFNLFNSVNFRQPDSRAGTLYLNLNGASDFFNCSSNTCIFTNPLFGNIVQAKPPRQVQLALKLTF